MLFELALIIQTGISISVGCLIFCIYSKSNNICRKIKMNVDELLQNIPTDGQHDTQEASHPDKRERLSAIVVGGGSKQYLGRELQLTDIDEMSAENINKLYCRYETRLGASMTKTLGNSIINVYVMGVSKYFNVGNPPQLTADLKEDPFINHALTSVCCELYYKYGMYLAPFTAMLTTARHIDFNTDRNKNIEVENIEVKTEP